MIFSKFTRYVGVAHWLVERLTEDAPTRTAALPGFSLPA